MTNFGGRNVSISLGARDLMIHIADLCLDVYLLKVMLFLAFCFLSCSCGDSTWRGMCWKYLCALFRFLCPCSANCFICFVVLCMWWAAAVLGLSFLNVVYNGLCVDRKKSCTVKGMPEAHDASVLRSMIVSGMKTYAGTMGTLYSL